jgi:methylated-DNA-[protein]-cysteine S-methyltransferase
MSTDRAHSAGTIVHHATLPTPLGTLHILGTARGLVSIALPAEPYADAAALAARLLGPITINDDDAPLSTARDQLAAYFAGTRQCFDLPLDLHGTPFQCAVWRAVMAIPYGETRHYSTIATALCRPNAARAVGAANAANPLAPIIPCHRLVGTDGALRGHRSGLATKRWLIEHEKRVAGASAS